jgi:hypothetical protein
MSALRRVLFGKARVAIPYPEPAVIDVPIRTLYLRSLCASFTQHDTFKHVRGYCMFVGYPRSGHSLLGAIIDAHPHALCAHELDALGLVEAGFSRRQIYSLILKNSADFARHGRVWTYGYKYEIPGQWNGRFERLLLMGDKKGGLSSTRFARNPRLLQKLRRVMGSNVKLLHVVRNPFDNIGTMTLRGMQLGDAVEEYFDKADAVVSVSRQIDPRDFLTVSHEELIQNPSAVIQGVCEFLGLAPRPDYVDACCRVIHKQPHRTRAQIAWDPQLLSVAQTRAAANPFLREYAFE